MNSKGTDLLRKLGYRALALATVAVGSAMPAARCLAISQEDLFKSISQNVSESGNNSGMTFIWVLLGAVALIILLAYLNSRGQREEAPKTFNHEGKLLKELAKELSIKPAEMRQLKLLAEGEREAGSSLNSPLVFLLCPSLMVAAAKAGRVKYDRKILAGLAAKLGLTQSAQGRR